MNESRIRTPPRQSTDDIVRGHEPLTPNDFSDVFGGPPRTLLSRQHSVDFATSATLAFDDIPASEDELYSYMFGDSWKSRRSRSTSQTNSNSKSNSSSILSSEELSPFRPAVGDGDDVSLSSFAAKIRPINVTYNLNTPKKLHEACNYGFSHMVSFPETTTFGPYSYASVKESTEDMQVNSPASIVSSLNQDQGNETRTILDEDDDIMSSYVIEINLSKHRERIGESLGAEETHGVTNIPEVRINESNESSSLDKENIWTTQELEKDASKQMELELLDEDIRLWSDGKESNIRLLLATLHHILCPSSGWIMIPLTNLKDSPDVRKAYQKARLCLHPDKLPRDAAILQKYVAEKAFPILQDAWAAFISQDVLLSIS